MTVCHIAALAALLAGFTVAPPTIAGPLEPAPSTLNLEPLDRVAGRPPLAGSSAERDDLAVLRWLQRYRTPEQVADAWLLLDRNLALFSRALGLDLAKSAPGLLRGLRPFLAEVDGASSQLKLQARRPRPYTSHPELEPCLPPETGYSFPSGHATWYSAAAELLAALVPERRERLLQVGSHGGSSRVMCGVHYPSDVEAGQRLGRAAALQIQQTAAWRRLRDDPALQLELQQIRSLPFRALPELVR